MKVNDAHLLAQAFSLAGEAMLVTDEAGHVVAINNEFSRSTGWSPQTIAAQSLQLLWSSDHGAQVDTIMAAVAANGRWQGEVLCRHGNGVTQFREATVTGLANGFIVVMPDPKRRHVGRIDSLTGLPDRSVFMERLKTTCAQVERKHMAAAVLFLDLDNFKHVNDTLGHDAGDRLLKEAARRLKSCVRESDTVCRLGGDEFTIILAGLNQVEEAEVVAQHILGKLAHPFDIGGSISPMSASIGIAALPNDGISPDELLRRADAAMYQAKRSGRATYSFYSQEMMARAIERAHLERELRHAHLAGEIELLFQPIVNLTTRRVTGSHAMLQWNSPRGGLLNAGQFLPVAEECGLIRPLGEWLMTRMVQTLVAWRQAGLGEMKICVGLSRRQLGDLTLFEHLLEGMKANNLSPALVEFEVCADALGDDKLMVRSVLATLSAFGVGLIIDDFGHGHVALQTLQHPCLRAVKIHATQVQKNKTIAGALIRLSHALNIPVVAEWVDNNALLNGLAEAGCDYAEGNMLAPPLDGHAFAALLKSPNAEIAA
ncbi:MAG: diguanylate cyclase [Rhodospirillaceae bacterium]|nr:diguanylate cyclase [Rhodospirillales bacterium]